MKENQDMNRQDLLEFLRNLEIGTRIPGAITGKTFTFGGLKVHSGRGNFPNVKGELMVKNKRVPGNKKLNIGGK